MYGFTCIRQRAKNALMQKFVRKIMQKISFRHPHQSGHYRSVRNTIRPVKTSSDVISAVFPPVKITFGITWGYIPAGLRG
ncbi:hypothetical protein EYC80_005446 [Monilinia laxa]|uniref:Uncharacterized protein n=1 Tax=Monilinia laxa TaxID=61186 RepID=A0A5N6KE27_MONLA|nr:hypothetical protein EYC80_005446 [Monilinia laxa]